MATSSSSQSNAFLDPKQAHVISILNQINQKFYDRFADDFHQSRGHGWKGWLDLLPLLPNRPLQVLDLGCGNGRLADFLDRVWCQENQQSVAAFYGADQCEPLLDFARQRTLSFPHQWSTWSWETLFHSTSFPSEQLHGKELDELPQDSLESKSFPQSDWVSLFGVMHHVFSYSCRFKLMYWALSHVKPGGVLSVSYWDFGAHSKWDKKKLDWNPICQKYGFAQDLIEEGDFLLGWSGHHDTPRYCHWISRQEEAQLNQDLLHALGEENWHTPRLTSREGDLNRYWNWIRKEKG